MTAETTTLDDLITQAFAEYGYVGDKPAAWRLRQACAATERDLTAAREQIRSLAEQDYKHVGELLQERARVGDLLSDLDAARARVAELETFVRWVATYPKTRGEEINVVLIRDGARALLSPSPEPRT